MDNHQRKWCGLWQKTQQTGTWNYRFHGTAGTYQVNLSVTNEFGTSEADGISVTINGAVISFVI